MSGFNATNILLIVSSGNSTKHFEQSPLDPTRKEASLALNDPDFDTELVSIGSNADEVKIFDFTPDSTVLQKLFNIIHPKGKIVIADRGGLGQSIILELQLCGFVDVTAINDPTRNDDKFIVGQRPSWNIGEAARVSIKNSDSKQINTSWKMSNDDLAEDDLVDENELLNDNIQIPAPTAACGDESTSGKKRACKNCTCGLAEQEMQEAGTAAPLSEEQKVVKASACGNCYKGDAFRCGSCPFLGKPAFEPGLERVVLSLGDDI